ncbi:TlyA family RNA methyltransferase [Candidatus Dependentiae bacterium]|nr:TlyA family RNA methyltransferase [Candidatus Dependentiae bacterium]
MKLERLDLVLLKKYPQYSRTFIARGISQAAVSVNGMVVTRPGHKISEMDIVVAHLVKEYVGFAGYKLAAALMYFKINLSGLVCLDAGLSTGGFSDCLLQEGALLVYGIDVGSAQVDASLKNNEKLIIMEQQDIRMVSTLPQAIDFCCLDLSFISLKMVIPVVEKLLSAQKTQLLLLIKPQFEVGREFVNKNGIVKSQEDQDRAVQSIIDLCKSLGFSIQGVVRALKKEENGNNEYFLYCTR